MWKLRASTLLKEKYFKTINYQKSTKKNLGGIKMELTCGNTSPCLTAELGKGASDSKSVCSDSGESSNFLL